MSQRGQAHAVKSRKRALATGKYIALVGIPGTAATIAVTVLLGMALGAIGC